MSRLVAIAAIAVSFAVVDLVVPQTAVAEASAAAVDVQDELPDDAGRIIGSPDPGPDPEHSGDRGGWAQLALLGVLAAGVGFILWRVIRAARRAQGSAPG